MIIGGSMSGLFTAAFLRQIGWDIDDYERSSVDLVGRGAGITTHPELLEALDRTGAGLHDLGVEVEKRITVDRSGNVIAEKRLPQILSSWERLQSLMGDTIDAQNHHLGQNFERLEHHGAGVVAHFSEARRSAPIRSSAPTEFAQACAPSSRQPYSYSGYYIWRAQ